MCSLHLCCFLKTFIGFNRSQFNVCKDVILRIPQVKTYDILNSDGKFGSFYRLRPLSLVQKNEQIYFFESFSSFQQNIIKMLSVTSLTHLLLMQMLITLQTIHNYNAIRNRKYEWIVYLGLYSMISSPHPISDMSSGLSRSFITWQPHKLNICSMSRKENWLVHLSSLWVWVVRSSRDSPIHVTYAVWAGKRID